MVMRGKLLLISILLAAVLSLSSCVKSIQQPADELKMYTWSGSFEHGSDVTLSFTQTEGYLEIENDDSSLSVGGLCMLTDDELLIFDENSGMNYSFGYRLYGDRVELNRDGSVLTLKKVESD